MAAEHLKHADLVFEGGGVKGIALAGAFGALWNAGYRPDHVAGTSAGAITAALVAAGYDGSGLRRLVLDEMDLPRFEDPSPIGPLGAVADGERLIRHLGLHSGEYFSDWIAELLSAQGVTCFGDLRAPDDSGVAGRQYRLQVVASDLSARSMLVLPRDAAQIGADPDRLEIARAVRMSMSIPGFYTPVVCSDDHHRAHTIVDGGLLSNYPIGLFDVPPPQRPQHPTFGLLLVAPGQRAPLLPHPPPDAPLARVDSPIELGAAVLETMMEAHDRLYVEAADFARTIALDTLGVGTLDFHVDAARKRELYASGERAAEEFLGSRWDFTRYIDSYRSPESPEAGRRRALY